MRCVVMRMNVQTWKEIYKGGGKASRCRKKSSRGEVVHRGQREQKKERQEGDDESG